MAEKWRWFDQPRHGDPDDCRHRLAVDDGSKFGGRTILECGNLDSDYQDRIAAGPDLEAACARFIEVFDSLDGPTEAEIDGAADMMRAALAKARGGAVRAGR